jgi:uncharacterized protein YcaQ
MPDVLSRDQARRVALAAQGLAAPARATRAGPATLRATLERLGAIQIDSINVVARSHELVLHARAGPHDRSAFDRLVYRRRAGFEYWAHAASFLPIDRFRLCLPRMRRLASSTRGWWGDIRQRHRHLYGPVLDRVRAEGPLAASAFRDPGGPRRGSWWDWAPAKHVLEDLFDQGTLLVHDRVNFERRYDLAERVLPPGTDTSEPTAAEAALELTLLAARALGVGTAADLADYYRLRPADARAALAEALAAGLLREVAVAGWAKPAYLPPGTGVPRRVAHPPVLLSPFDSLIWSRERTERLFGFTYRLEVYVPAGKRVHGYYTLPLLLDGRLVARVDPKYERQTGVLILRRLTIEDGVAADVALAGTAAAAWRLATHLKASDVEAGPDLPRALARGLTVELRRSG